MNIEIESCIQCVHHTLKADPDPDDWFRDSDEMVFCKKANKPVVRYLTVFEVKKPKESPVPDWCPLMKDKPKKGEGEFIL